MRAVKVACLTLDVELDHHDLVAPCRFADVLDDARTWVFLREASTRYNAPITAFVVGQLLEEKATLAERLAATCAEIGLHSYSHRSDTADSLDEIRRGKEAYRRAFGQEPLGYRAPLGLITPAGWRRLQDEGFLYDSSLYPSLRPGRFNHLGASLHPRLVGGEDGRRPLVELPLAALCRLRLMFSVSFIKMIGTSLYRPLLAVGGLPPVVVLNCHLHDLTFAANAYAHLSPLWKAVYGRHRHGGKQALLWALTTLQTMGYTFCTLRTVAESVLTGRWDDGV